MTMNEIDATLAHISCDQCGQSWQVLNEEGTDWDEHKTALNYRAQEHSCEPSERGTE